jgi:hypothetical protein
VIRQMLSIAVLVLCGAVFTPCSAALASNRDEPDLTEGMKDSIVYLEVSTHGYSQSEPWKFKRLSESWACACAVGEYEVVTTAASIANLAFLRARRYGQSEFVGASVEVVDYDTNLCLIRLDPNALGTPLKPLAFSEDYVKGAEVRFYWLSPDSQLYNGRGYLDRASVEPTLISHGQRLCYIAANTSQRTARGEVYCIESSPVGIAYSSTEEKESILIPGETINRFLKAATGKSYKGFGEAGFALSELLNPAMRAFLKMPASIVSGAYVADVYNLGTGRESLKKGDVILSIDGNSLDPYGRFLHPKYGQVSFSYLITSKSADENVLFELWRDGKKMEIRTGVESFDASQMLVPYHEYDRQPEYIVTSGFVLRKLTRDYLMEFGEDMAGQSPPHLYHYYRDLAFKPTPERQDVVILSYVLPAPFNLGYPGLGQMVVSKFNGMTIRSIKDISTAQQLYPESAYDIIEFELDNPVVVIPRRRLSADDQFISRNYGIAKLSNLNP